MPEKFFYTFLILFILSITGYANAIEQDLKDTRPVKWIKNVGSFSWVGIIISAICWIWS